MKKKYEQRSTSTKNSNDDGVDEAEMTVQITAETATITQNDEAVVMLSSEEETQKPTGADAAVVVVDWREILKDLLQQDGGILNLFVGLPARCSFFFLVIGLQFFLYDYFKTLLAVGS